MRISPKYFFLLLLVMQLLSCVNSSPASAAVNYESGDSVSIRALQQKLYKSTLAFEKELAKTHGYQSSLMSYSSDGLKIFTLINRPNSSATEGGYPVIIFGHGFHPKPEKYGVSNSTGKDWRPGDYYRGIPEAYVEKGYLVITPDYRGHNQSEGFEYTQRSYLASSYYASDVLHLLSALSSLPDANLNKIYYMGHSMGGDVGLKMLLATHKIRAASLWAPVVATTPEQALYYGNKYDELSPVVDDTKMDQYMEKINSVYAALPTKITTEQVDPTLHLDSLTTPLIIHHARGDESVPYSWSESLIVKLDALNKEYEFYAYESDNHLFDEANRKIAVEHDIKFFQTH